MTTSQTHYAQPINTTSKERRMRPNSGEMILVGLCFCGIAFGAMIGIPSVSQAVDSMVSDRFLSWLLSSSPLLMQIFKWGSIGVCGLIISALIKFKMSAWLKYPLIAGTMLIAVSLFSASAAAATGLAVGLALTGIKLAAYCLIQGIQAYALVKRERGFNGRGDKHWARVSTAAFISYLFEFALNVVYNPAFQPLRDLTVGGQLLASVWQGTLLLSVATIVLQIALMLLSIVVVEFMILMIFSLLHLRAKA